MLQIPAEEISDEQALFGPGSLGLDSVDALQLVVALDKNYGLKIPDPDAAKIERAFKSAVTERVNALVVISVGGIATHTAQIANLAVKNRLPAMYTVAEAIRNGGLVSYADDALDRLGRVAEYVDRILKGTKPADLPVQRPAKFELIVNLNAAKQIGLTVPANVLARADKIVK